MQVGGRRLVKVGAIHDAGSEEGAVASKPETICFGKLFLRFGSAWCTTHGSPEDRKDDGIAASGIGYEEEEEPHQGAFPRPVRELADGHA